MSESSTASARSMARAVPPRPVRDRLRNPSASWRPPWPILLFLGTQILCHVSLLFFGNTPARVPLRIGAFAISLAMLAILWPRARVHPAGYLAFAILFIVTGGLFHPERETLVASVAQIAMYVAILAPIWWVAATSIDARGFRAVIVLLWGFYVASACAGVLQTLFPGRFQPVLSSVVESKGEALVEGYKITLASGEMVFRPMGLTDTPGGAAVGGLYAVVLGMGLVLFDRSTWLRCVAFLAMFAGLYCILLSQVRSILLMVGICSVALTFLLLWRADWQKLQAAALMFLGVAVTGAGMALAIGGNTVVERLKTLVEDDPLLVYYYNRGNFLHYMIDFQLAEFPMGAGLGRWGMMNRYFGDPRALKEPLWAEIQWQGWLFDGGIPLMLAYGAAVVVAIWVAWRIAMRVPGALGRWASIIFAYNVGALALTFNNPVFFGQSGLEFWLLNACLFNAALRERSTRAAHSPQGGAT